MEEHRTAFYKAVVPENQFFNKRNIDNLIQFIETYQQDEVGAKRKKPLERENESENENRGDVSATTLYRSLKKYNVVTVPLLDGGIEKLLLEKESNLQSSRRFVSVETWFDVILDHHVSKTGHGGVRKTLASLKLCFANITESTVRAFVLTCSCQLKARIPSRTGITPILSTTMNERGQVDLIDMQCYPDQTAHGTFRWILHYIDHFTKFSHLRALERKEATLVGRRLFEIFCTQGFPSILQSDNGKEFVNGVIDEISRLTSGKTKIVHGRPRHPQTQGCVERANASVENMIDMWMREQGSTNWSTGLWAVQVHVSNNPLLVLC